MSIGQKQVTRADSLKRKTIRLRAFMYRQGVWTSMGKRMYCTPNHCQSLHFYKTTVDEMITARRRVNLTANNPISNFYDFNIIQLVK